MTPEPLVVPSAIAAVRAWRFEPGRRAGLPARHHYPVPLALPVIRRSRFFC